MDETGEWLTVQEAAERLGVTTQAIRNRIHRGTLKKLRRNDGQTITFISAEISAGKPESKQLPTPETLGEQPSRGPFVSLAVALDWVEAEKATSAEMIARVESRADAEIKRLREDHRAEIERLEKAWKSAIGDMMNKLTSVMIASRPRPSFLRRLFG